MNTTTAATRRSLALAHSTHMLVCSAERRQATRDFVAAQAAGASAQRLASLASLAAAANFREAAALTMGRASGSTPLEIAERIQNGQGWRARAEAERAEAHEGCGSECSWGRKAVHA